MKLYIWSNPYTVSYGSSLLIVAADNLREARRQATKGKFMAYGGFEVTWGFGPDKTIDLGKPTRVLKMPCAEWYEWAE